MNIANEPFVLARRLVQDTITLGDFPLCRLLLMNDCQYPWFILVPRVAGVEEIYQLEAQDQRQLMKEMVVAAEKFNDLYAADKMNIGALGNVVRQLHIHVIVRYEGDKAWPSPVWGSASSSVYTADALEAMRSQLAVAFTSWLALT